MVQITARLESRQIILTGFMGTGKTEVGKLLAAKLKRRFVDTDQLVKTATGLSVPLIFEKYGEGFFRERESKVVKSLDRYPPGSLVVATGGGVVLRENNRAMLKKVGLIVLLRASAEEICRRISGTGHRPLLNGPEPEQKVKKMLEEREPYYRNCDFEIDTTAKTPRQVASEILSCLNNR